MYKAKSASMMRGAKIRASVGPRPRVPIPKTNAKTKPSELIQFGETKATRDAFLARLRPVVRQAREAGCSTDSRLATFLNANGWTTASRERWTARRAVVLRRLLYEQHKSAQGVRKAKASSPAAPPKPSPEQDEPLSREELFRRLESLGRVSGA